MGPGVLKTIGVLRKLIADSKSRHLPSASALACRFGVSYPTLLRAARVLRDEGLLDFSRGGRVRICRLDEVPVEPARISSTERIFEDIKQSIRSGELRKGQYLPKLQVLAGKYSVSTRTLCRAVRLLQVHGLIHRRGRSWICGTPVVAAARATASGSHPVIAVLSNKESDWRGLFVPRTEGFVRTFSSEAENHGVQLLPIGSTGRKELYRMDALDVGEASLLIPGLGERYLGTLVIVTQSKQPELSYWLRMLASYGRPVVWFDRYDEDRKLELPQNCRRCHFDERAAIRLCVEYLYNLGHRQVGYLWRRQKWESVRRDIMINEMANLGGMKLVYPADTGNISEVVDNVTADPATTALVASNDIMARGAFYRLREKGLRPGIDISMISFDNSPELLPLPVTTIDFGFDTLGYDAFHLILRDLPERTSRVRSIGARPRIVLRESVRAI